MFIDEAKSSTVLYSWIGQPVKFICGIILKPGADSPDFKWKNVEKNVTFEVESVPRKWSELEINPKSDSDFGTYKCYAWTHHTEIKRNMTLRKVGKLISIMASSFPKHYDHKHDNSLKRDYPVKRRIALIWNERNNYLKYRPN
jgi:hypothetical protein